LDRDGRAFSYVLNFLRGQPVTTELEPFELALLKEDAKFYEIEALSRALGDPSCNQSPEKQQEQTKLNTEGYSELFKGFGDDFNKLMTILDKETLELQLAEEAFKKAKQGFQQIQKKIEQIHT